MQSLFILSIYEINKKTITAAFCENKMKPAMHCNGKCHLKKELQKQEKSEKKNTNLNKENRVELNEELALFILQKGRDNSHSILFSYLNYQFRIVNPFLAIDSPPPQSIS
jgi:hypothetical protein